jgi:ferredoxin-2, mitochondrial
MISRIGVQFLGKNFARVPKTAACNLRSRMLSTSGDEETVQIHWTLKDGTKMTTNDPLGGNLMRAAHRHGIELEGACEGVCACSTCHVIFEEDVFDELPEASEDEDDMLDQAFGLTPTSRLGCQIIIHKGLDGIHVELPPHTRNFAVDGHFNKPH